MIADYADSSILLDLDMQRCCLRYGTKKTRTQKKTSCIKIRDWRECTKVFEGDEFGLLASA